MTMADPYAGHWLDRANVDYPRSLLEHGPRLPAKAALLTGTAQSTHALYRQVKSNG